jgi:hypothetical protein
VKDWDFKGAVAMIIALTFGVVLVSTVVGAIATGRGITAETAHLLSTIAGALIGVLSAYVGEKVSEK